MKLTNIMQEAQHKIFYMILFQQNFLENKSNSGVSIFVIFKEDWAMTCDGDIQVDAEELVMFYFLWILVPFR
jgi:hypothetical protein